MIHGKVLYYLDMRNEIYHDNSTLQPQGIYFDWEKDHTLEFLLLYICLLHNALASALQKLSHARKQIEKYISRTLKL